MNDITRRGVYNNLELSPYKFKHGGLCLNFSSKASYERFLNRYKDDYQRYLIKMKMFFGMEVDVIEPSLIYSYLKAETRAFYIILDGEKVCLDKIKFVGNLVKKNSLKEKSEILIGED